MVMNPVKLSYISCSCNISPHSADWGRNNLIAYGSCNATAFYNVDKYSYAGQVESTLCTNKSRVNVVQWLRTSDGALETEGLSGSAEGMLVHWNYVTKQCTTLEGHQMGVTVIDSVFLPSEPEVDKSARTLVASASADSTVKLWVRKENDDDAQFSCAQTLDLGRGICLSLRMCRLPGTQSVLLACAIDDASVRLYATDCCLDVVDFVRVDSLVGHEDWVRALDFTQDDSGDVLLASGSQDATVRLWRISPCSSRRARKPFSQLGPTEEIEAEERIFLVGEQNFSVTLESVLSGHEGWVYGIAWHPRIVDDTSKTHQPMTLLTSSMDKTMIIWSPDEESDIWYEKVRVGDVGGNSLGFYGCKFSPDGGAIVGHGYQGAFSMWTRSEDAASWTPRVACGGHFQAAVDAQWAPRGEYLLSVGVDQTTRLHAAWRREGRVSWHELARPQVHGFDMSCIALLDAQRFCSGSEEKLVRCFSAPRRFLHALRGVVGGVAESEEGGAKSEEGGAEGASVPSLGLSNKAVFAGAAGEEEGCREYDTDKPPTEDILLQSTLWPEERKLYGHGYEVYCLAARGDGKMLASACKASTVEHAAIILWDTTKWQELQRLVSHKLTVTQLSFSPCLSHLLSVSRDRSWTLFTRDSQDSYTLSHRNSGHSRIIWTCAWSHDSLHFATGSRDGKTIIWNVSPSDVSQGISSIPIPGDSVTATAFAADFIQDGFYLIAVGFESGLIRGYKWKEGENMVCCFEMDNNVAHHMSVRRLCFRPMFGEEERERGEVQLASCGTDHAVKVYDIDCRQF